MLKRWAAWPRDNRWLAGIAVLGLAIVWLLFVPVADWVAHHDVGAATGALHETAMDNARGRLLTLGAGLLAAGALWFTARNFTLSREGQVTDRYTKAIEQLGSDKLDVRIGGIYALERVARDSARDHPTVMEVLAAFIREHSHEQWRSPDHPASREQERLPRPDIQAAFSVVGRRDQKYDIRLIDLTGAHLAGANLPRARLRNVNLAGADLTDARLHDASVTGAVLGGADLAGANLTGADLTDANLCTVNLAGVHFFCAKLTGAFLVGATLTGAILALADLTGADLAGANLTDVNLTDVNLGSTILTRANLTGAKWAADTPVPEGWERDADSGRLRAVGTGPETAEAS